MAPISAAHSTCSAVSQAQAQVKALTSCILSSSGPVVSCATGQNVLGILSLNNAFGAGLCSLDPLSNLSGLLGGLLGSLGGLGGLSGLLSCLVGGTVALLNSILALNGCGCDPSLIGGLLAAVQGLLRDLNALLACGRSCTSCNSGQITNEVLALIAKSGLN
jgi:hypothetical protein